MSIFIKEITKKQNFIDSFGNEVNLGDYVQHGFQVTNKWDIKNNIFYDYSKEGFIIVRSRHNFYVLNNQFKKLNKTEISLYLLKK